MLYVSNNKEVAQVSPDGVVEAVRHGRDRDHRAGGRAVRDRRASASSPRPRPIIRRSRGCNFIDDHVFAKLRKLRIVPAPLSRDDEFLRRVCLDLTGTLAAARARPRVRGRPGSRTSATS